MSGSLFGVIRVWFFLFIDVFAVSNNQQENLVSSDLVKDAIWVCP